MKAIVVDFTLDVSDLPSELDELHLEDYQTLDSWEDDPVTPPEEYMEEVRQEMKEWERVKDVGEVKKIDGGEKPSHNAFPLPVAAPSVFAIEYVLNADGSTELETITMVTRTETLDKPLGEVLKCLSQLDIS